MTDDRDTESNIIGNIPDFDDDTENDTSETETEDTDSESTDDGDDAGDTSTTASSTENDASKPAADAPIVRRDGLHEVVNPDDPRSRNLVDPATGQVVARGGIERRIFENSQRLTRDNASLLQRVQAAETSANNANEIVKLGSNLSLSSSDQTASFNLMSQFLKDPVRMLEQLVIEVKSKGYDIPFLENGVTPGMDTAAISHMVDARMQPITEANRARDNEAAVHTQARKTLETFLDRNPEGEHNLSVMAEMITKEPGLTIDDAYMRLIKWSSSNGYDYSQPLQQQINARNNSQQQPVGNSTQTSTQPRQVVAPLPNGRQPNRVAPINEPAMYDENASWETIIRRSMRDTGMSV